MDANRHLRHSAYYDFGAMARIAVFSTHGITGELLEELKLGPILFREEAVFRREIRYEHKVAIDTLILQATEDYSRWTIRHRLFRDENELAATLTVDGAWIDLDKRKLAIPPPAVQAIYEKFPRAEEFQWQTRK